MQRAQQTETTPQTTARTFGPGRAVAGLEFERFFTKDGGDPFDFAFIDADKTGYPGYYEQCLQLLHSGGVIALDNMLSRGRVLGAPIDPGSEADTAALKKMNELIHHDQRVDAILLPFGDGLTLAVKR